MTTITATELQSILASTPQLEQIVGRAPGRRCLVVLPTYNERENLQPMVEAILHRVDVEILVVDDNSPDGTGRLADQLSASRQSVHVLHRADKQGLGTAYIAGFRWGLRRGFDRLIEMDCDFSHDPDDLPRLLARAAKADLVIGSRYVPGGSTEDWSLPRRLLSRCGNLYASAFLGESVRDWTGGFRCYRADALTRIDLDAIDASGYAFQVQMAWAIRRTGGRIVEIPIRFTDRRLGTSKMNRAIALEAIRKIPMMRFSRVAKPSVVDAKRDAVVER